MPESKCSLPENMSDAPPMERAIYLYLCCVSTGLSNVLVHICPFYLPFYCRERDWPVDDRRTRSNVVIGEA